jgi:pimeloyl-ACP methyl ester carboxylesterase
MNRVRSGDAELSYAVIGDGPPVVLLHPFPAHHEFWLPASQALTRYRLIMPDLRGHGDSDAGDGPATMAKHADDLSRVLQDADVGRAVFCGVSIGGYILFEFWRKFPGRVAGLVLSDTRPQPDSPEARTNRLRIADDVIEKGTESFVESMLPKLIGKSTFSARPDLVDQAKRMAMKMSPSDIAQVQRGMAARPDSVPTLKTINVPTLVMVGEEDVLTPVTDAELMRQHLPVSTLRVISKAGHFAPWEQPEEVGRLLRQFVDSLQ